MHIKIRITEFMRNDDFALDQFACRSDLNRYVALQRRVLALFQIESLHSTYQDAYRTRGRLY